MPSLRKIGVPARSIVERLTRNIVYRRRLPEPFNDTTIYVTPSAGLKYLVSRMSTIDAALLRNAKELVRPGDVVWDVGANVGLFAFAAAWLAGQNGSVIAFEPDTFLIDCLRRSAKRRAPQSALVTVVPAAVASAVSLRNFLIASRSRASNAISGYGQTQAGKSINSQTVVTVSLDWLAERLPVPNVIKCDVEGAELEVFAGQSRILTKARPVIVCEVAEVASAQMTTLFSENGYALYDGDQALSVKSGTERTSWNTVAIPEELKNRYIPGLS